MGAPMAKRILSAGFDLSVVDDSPKMLTHWSSWGPTTRARCERQSSEPKCSS